MLTDAQVDRVVDVALVALDTYRPDRQFYDLVNSVSEDALEGGVLVVEVAGTSQNLRNVSAALDAVQLAFDAAAVAVLYAADDPQRSVQERDIKALQMIARDPRWALEIEEFEVGSFRVKLRGLLTTSDGRNRILNVAGLAATLLFPLVPGVAVTAIIVLNGLQYANGAFDDALDKLLERRLRQAERPTPREPKARSQALHAANVQRAQASKALAADLKAIELDIEEHVLAKVDRDSLANAGVTSIVVNVEINVQRAA